VKRFYLDTNVFLARYASTEKEHNSSTRLLDAMEHQDQSDHFTSDPDRGG